MLDINALFDENYYFSQNPDVQKAVADGAFSDGLEHFLKFGKFEQRDPSEFFDTGFYLALYPDIATAVKVGQTTAIDHFINFGQFEKRDPFVEFNTSEYLIKNPDVAAAVTDSTGQADPLTGIQHFIKNGQFEGRDPGGEFNTSFYLQRNPDVAGAVKANKTSAIKHYINFGFDEGRQATPPSPDQDLSLANSLGSLKGSKSISDSVSTTDSDDLYNFTLDTTSALNINLTGLSNNAKIELISDLSGDGELDYDDILTESDQPGATEETINQQAVAPGTYYVRVADVQGDTKYSLNVSATPTLDPSKNPPPAQPDNFNYYYGRGLVDVQKALEQATQKPVASADPLTQSQGDNFADLNLMNAGAAWKQGINGQGVIVAVLDDGVSIDHADLKDNIWKNPGENGLDSNGKNKASNGIDDDGNGFVDDYTGWDFVQNTNDPNPPTENDTHGTHVAGTIAALNNNTGTTGIAYNAKIMPLRVLGSKSKGESGGNDEKQIAPAIRYAVDNGATVINMSLGSNPAKQGPEPPEGPLANALSYAREKGVVVVIASGNERQDLNAVQPGEPAFQAANGLALAVGAVDVNKKVADFSNPVGATGKTYPFIVAPGVDVKSTVKQRDYEEMSGTSMATPHVAGVAALLKQVNPNFTAQQIEAFLTGTANPSGITV